MDVNAAVMQQLMLMVQTRPFAAQAETIFLEMSPIWHQFCRLFFFSSARVVCVFFYCLGWNLLLETFFTYL
jgi:hypothetical protein